MARVLLSGASEDRPGMRRLAEALRRAGHEPRLDVDDIAPADTWPAALERAIARSDALIIGYSAATARSDKLPFYIAACWSEAAAPKLTLVARFDQAPLPSDLIGVRVFDLRRDSWDRDVELLIAALTRPTSPFVGREAELAWLARHLHAGASVAVVGESGVGKSALAAEYVRRHAAEYPGGCLRWFHDGTGRDRQWVRHGRSTRSEPRLLITETEDLAGDVSTWLDRQRSGAGATHTIVTALTRSAEFPGAVLELAPLPGGDAALLFERRAGSTDDPAEIQERNQIVAATGGIPLAVVSAADLYRRGWRLASSAAAIIPFIAAAAPPDSPGRSLLEGMLPFAAGEVPIAWAALVGGAGPETEAAAVARRLETAGLMRLGPDPDTIMVHPVVHAALRELTAPEAQRAMRARAEELVTRWLTNTLARAPVPGDPLLEHAETLANDDDDEAPTPWRGALQERLAELHRRRGDRYRALQLLERAERNTARHRAVHGDLHAIVTAKRASLASESDDHDGARRALAEAIAAAQRRPPDGSVRWRDVDPTAYQEALAAALDTAEVSGDPGNAARAAFLLADFHGRRGAWERAAPIAEQALWAARRASEPILIALAYRLLADVALHGSRYEDARASYEEALRRLDALGAEELAATSRLLYINLVLQLNRREVAIHHAEWLRAYLDRAPAGWPYHAEAAQTLRLFDGSATESEE